MYLLINHNKNKHSERYRLFSAAEDAVKIFNELSKGCATFPMDLTPGMMNMVDAGADCNIGLINLEEN